MPIPRRIHQVDQNHIITCSDDMTAKMWALGDDGTVTMKRLFKGHEGAVTSCCVDPYTSQVGGCALDRSCLIDRLCALGPITWTISVARGGPHDSKTSPPWPFAAAGAGARHGVRR